MIKKIYRNDLIPLSLRQGMIHTFKMNVLKYYSICKWKNLIGLFIIF